MLTDPGQVGFLSQERRRHIRFRNMTAKDICRLSLAILFKAAAKLFKI